MENAPLAGALRYLLRTEGFIVDVFAGAKAMLAGGLDPAPAGLILDHVLGTGGTGVEALEAARDRGLRAPAILIAVRPTAALRRRAERAGARVLEMPILGGRLLETVQSLIGRPGGDLRK